MDGDGTKNGSARTHEFLDTGPSSSSKDVAAMYGHVLVGGFEAWEGWNSARREPVPLLREDDRNEKGKSTAEAEAVDRRGDVAVARSVSPPIGIPPINLHFSRRA